MKLTKNVISESEARKLAPQYVEFIDYPYANLGAFLEVFNAMKVGQEAVTRYNDKYVKVRVSLVNHNAFGAVDGPIIRVSNGEHSWRVDGCDYAYPIIKK